MTAEHSISEGELDERLERFFAESDSQGKSPSGGEQVIGDFNAVLPEAYAKLPPFRRMVDQYVATETVPAPSYWVKKIFKDTQVLLIPHQMRQTWGYPYGFDGSRWLDFMAETFSNPKHPDYRRMSALLPRQLQTNRPWRAQAVAYGAAYLHHRQQLEDPPTVIDHGSSNGMVLRALKTYARGESTVLDKDHRPDKIYTPLFNMIVSNAQVGETIGIEKEPPKTAADHERIKAHTLDPSQFDSDGDSTSSSYEDDYDKLADADFEDSITTIEANFLKLSEQQKDVIVTKGRNGIGAYSFVLAANRRLLKKTIQTGLEEVGPRGILVATEYMTIDPDDPQKLNLLDNWYDDPWLCMTAILDARHLEKGWRPAILWKTGSCEEAIVFEDLFA